MCRGEIGELIEAKEKLRSDLLQCVGLLDGDSSPTSVELKDLLWVIHLDIKALCAELAKGEASAKPVSAPGRPQIDIGI